jgi:hypothetical protein
VNSEPHTRARPSARLFVGPELARCVYCLWDIRVADLTRMQTCVIDRPEGSGLRSAWVPGARPRSKGCPFFTEREYAGLARGFLFFLNIRQNGLCAERQNFLFTIATMSLHSILIQEIVFLIMRYTFRAKKNQTLNVSAAEVMSYLVVDRSIDNRFFISQ